MLEMNGVAAYRRRKKLPDGEYGSAVAYDQEKPLNSRSIIVTIT